MECMCHIWLALLSFFFTNNVYRRMCDYVSVVAFEKRIMFNNDVILLWPPPPCPPPPRAPPSLAASAARCLPAQQLLPYPPISVPNRARRRVECPRPASSKIRSPPRRQPPHWSQPKPPPHPSRLPDPFIGNLPSTAQARPACTKTIERLGIGTTKFACLGEATQKNKVQSLRHLRRQNTTCSNPAPNRQVN